MDDRSATGGSFPCDSSTSGTIRVTVVDASRVEGALGDDAELGSELGRLLGSVFGGGADPGREWEARCGRDFRGLMVVGSSQGVVRLGGRNRGVESVRATRLKRFGD